MDTQVDLSGAKKASRRALPAGMTVEAAVVLPVFLFAVANLLSLFLVFWTYSSKEAQLHQTASSACAVCLWAGGWRTGCTADAADAGLCAIWDSRFSEQLCRKRVRDAQMDWLQRGTEREKTGNGRKKSWFILQNQEKPITGNGAVSI